ncbi:MAG: TonB-dependent receptor plug domain-containing protein [Kofleriaceae bacterium]|nr:TonB-dependent receptor plug domain-containing protein [Kofleriaceae bacterium]
MLVALTVSTAAADVRGRIVDAETRVAVVGATVYGDDPETVFLTADDGSFIVLGSPPALTVVAVGYEPAVVEVGEAPLLLVELMRVAKASGRDDGEVIEISGGRLTATPGATTIDRAEITRVPGARGDVLSGVKNLPGVANNGSLTPLSAGLIIRGASPEDSRILVDGFEIPVLYHFLGVQSVLPSEMIEDVEYQPGTFGVSQGRASAGLVSVTSRDAATTHGAFAELSFVNAAGLVQGPIGKRGSFAFAGRRSVLDAILPGVVPSDAGLAFTAYPRYYDYQAKVAYQPRERWKLSAFAFGSDDRVELLTDGDNAGDPAAAGGFSNATSFTRVIASATYKHAGVRSVTGISLFTDTNHFTVGRERFLNLDRDGVAARSELTWDATKTWRLVGGAEFDVTRTAFDMVFTRPPREGDPRGPNFTQDALLDATGSTTSPDVASWAQAVAYPIPSLELTGGLRVDGFVRNEVAVAQPRGQAVWRAADGSTLRAAAGLYTRPPEHLDESLQDDLDPERAVQTSVGFEQRLAPGLTFQATTFYNRLSDLLVLAADRRDPMSLGGYVNEGSGTAYGLELLLKLRTERVFGWLAYTGSRAVRRDGAMSTERRFDYDQAHNLIVVGSWKIAPHWQLGGRFQLTTGKPYTPVTGASYQADVDLYLPRYGATNSQRVAAQHQLDLRVDRTWRFDRWRLAAYLDISNVYLNAAAIDYAYNFDYTARTPITTLPIIPSFGVRGEI